MLPPAQFFDVLRVLDPFLAEAATRANVTRDANHAEPPGGNRVVAHNGLRFAPNAQQVAAFTFRANAAVFHTFIMARKAFLRAAPRYDNLRK